jgi:hypothetical protein
MRNLTCVVWLSKDAFSDRRESRGVKTGSHVRLGDNMRTSNFKIGDKVLFGRPNGEKTLGVVEKVNAASLKIRTLESRGHAHGAGVIWRVHPNLVEHAGDNQAPVTSQAPARDSEWTPRSYFQSTSAPKKARTEQDLVRELIEIDIQLSPENLSCDGELPRSVWRKRAASLEAERARLFAELGVLVFAQYESGAKSL